MSSEFKFSKELIQLRRAKVLELLAQAIPQNEIAKQLGVSTATISLDMQYLRCIAQENLKTHIEERIPIQYEECQTGLKLILRKTYEMVDKSTKPQEVISAMALAVDIYGKLMDLNTNGAILEKTTKWLAEKKETKLQNTELKENDDLQLNDIEESSNDEEPEEDIETEEE